MKGDELTFLMERAGLFGQRGAEELARRVKSSWRSVYRWKAGTVAITPMAEEAIRRALATIQAPPSRNRLVARKSKQTK